MKTLIGALSVVVLTAMGPAALASGFVCSGDSEAANLRVKLFNHIDPQMGTRVPAAMIISDTERGTLVVRKGRAISKRNRANAVQYVINGSSRLEADIAILQVQFKEGREVLGEREEVPAQLILIKDGDRSVFSLSCERYLAQE